MQFGLKNAPAVFQRMMNTQFADIIAQGNVIIYFDDILIDTENNLEAHRRVVGQVLDQLQKLNLYLKPSKCIFKTKKIEFLGVVLENGMVMMDPIKVSGVKEWKFPLILRRIVHPRDLPTSIDTSSPTFQRSLGRLMTSSKLGSNGIGEKSNRRLSKKSSGLS